MAHTKLLLGTTTQPSPRAPAYNIRSRRTSIKRRVILTAIALTIVVLALAGWAVRALRAAARPLRAATAIATNHSG